MNRPAAETAKTVARLRGMTDLRGPVLRRRESIRRRLAAMLDLHGYQPIDTPILEPTELFLRKSGGELAAQLLNFTDPAGRDVSLRPEFTAPAIRHYIEDAGAVDLPARWQYCGPVLRFDAGTMEHDSPDRSQFTQLGAELLGSPTVMADVELLHLAISCLSQAGISGWLLRLSSLEVITSLLAPFGLSGRARAFIVQNATLLSAGGDAIEHAMEQSRRLHIVGRASPDDYLAHAVQGLDDEEARTVLLGVLRSNPLDQLGQRDPDEIVQRLLLKIRRPDTDDNLRLALEAVAKLAQVNGPPKAALDSAAEILQHWNADQNAVQRLQRTVELLPDIIPESATLVVDFKLVKGLAYYNGLVFEVCHPEWPSPLGGGGRYDGLARDLGAQSQLSAVGFAYSLDAICSLSPDAIASDDGSGEVVLVIAANSNAQPAALKVAQEYRERGDVVEVEVNALSLAEALDWAARRGIRAVLSVDASGAVTAHDVRNPAVRGS